MILLKIITFLFFVTLCTSFTVVTKLGAIKGSEMTSRNGRTYYAFTRIPYAKPPIGKLRLKNPENIPPWSGVLDATLPAAPCLQVITYIHKLRNTTIGEEDCLYLNIYFPKIPKDKKLPVMLYIHGGAFRGGIAGPVNAPDYFMDEDIILVSVQYRVGALGFLSFEDDIIPGNFGIKDQAKALHWVHANIDAFGGDPNAITAFGDSAGGCSTHLLMMSPKTRGLLKGVISQSGTFNKYWAYNAPGTALPFAMQVASKFNCKNNDTRKTLECLQNVDAQGLIRGEMDLLFWDFHPAVVFRLVLEKPSEEAYLDFDPFNTVTNLPWVTGIVQDDGVYMRAVLMTQDDSVTQQFIDNIDDYIGRVLFLENFKLSKAELTETVELIKKKYFREPYTVKSVQEDVIDFYTDAYFVLTMYDSLKNHKGPVYQYSNHYNGAASLIDGLGDLDLGTSHADEILLLFNWTMIYPKTNVKDTKVSKQLVKMWANFAKYSNPAIENIEWPEMRSSRGKYIQFNVQTSIGLDLKKDVYYWWLNLPIYRSNRKMHQEL